MTSPTAFWVAIERDIVRVDGPDASTYLQGQLSQDLDRVPTCGSVWSLLLQPSGKVDAWLRVTRTADEQWALDVDAGWGAAVETRLTRFKLRTKCEVSGEPGTAFIAVRGVPREGGLPIVWPGVVGWDLVGTLPPDDVPEAGLEDYERLRIASGVPAMGRELTDNTIPAEAGQWLIDTSVSFTKGCYTGQELVARIDSRGGNVPRPIRLVVVEGEPMVAAGDEVVDGEGSVVGLLTSVAWDPNRSSGDAGATIALAPLARRIDPAADPALTVAGRPATAYRTG
jgi:tRNA-modifying protein YgfZ